MVRRTEVQEIDDAFGLYTVKTKKIKRAGARRNCNMPFRWPSFRNSTTDIKFYIYGFGLTHRTHKIQSINKKWQNLAWQSLAHLDLGVLRHSACSSASNEIENRINTTSILTFIRHPTHSQFWPTRNYPNLQYMETDTPEDVESLRNNHSQLYEMVYHGSYNDISEFVNAPCRVTAVDQYAIMRHETKDLITPKLNFSQSYGLLMQQDPTKFSKKYQRGGMIGEEVVVIGATDGTLSFYKIDFVNTRLVFHSNSNVHKGCINEIWNEQSLHTYVASANGIVTAWDYSVDGPVLVQTFTFPEEILFVCDSPTKHVLAAGRHELYIADPISAKTIRQVHVDAEITGLFGNRTKCTLSTIDQPYYTLKHDYFAQDNISILYVDPAHQPLANFRTLNFWVTPDASFRCVVFPHEVVSVDEHTNNAFSRLSQPTNTTFDSRSGLLKFNPTRYWLTVSTGPNIINYDLETKEIIWSVSARISRREIDAEQFPVCNSVWYSPQGDFLFGLYSNNTLCWWHFPKALVQASCEPPPTNIQQ